MFQYKRVSPVPVMGTELGFLQGDTDRRQTFVKNICAEPTTKLKPKRQWKHHVLLWVVGWELWGHTEAWGQHSEAKGSAAAVQEGLRTRQSAWALYGAPRPYSSLPGSERCFCWALSALPPAWQRDGASFPQQIANHSLLCFLTWLYLLFLSHTIAVWWRASVFCFLGLWAPGTVCNNKDSDRPPQGWAEQKPVTSGSMAGRLSDLMKSLRLHAGADWEWEKKLNLNNWILRSRHMLLL